MKRDLLFFQSCFFDFGLYVGLVLAFFLKTMSNASNCQMMNVSSETQCVLEEF